MWDYASLGLLITDLHAHLSVLASEEDLENLGEMQSSSSITSLRQCLPLEGKSEIFWGDRVNDQDS